MGTRKKKGHEMHLMEDVDFFIVEKSLVFIIKHVLKRLQNLFFFVRFYSIYFVCRTKNLFSNVLSNVR